MITSLKYVIQLKCAFCKIVFENFISFDENQYCYFHVQESSSYWITFLFIILFWQYIKWLIVIVIKIFCITESFNTNISHQLFDYTITFANSQHYNTNSKGVFVLKNRFQTFALKISGTQKLIRLRFGMTNLINKH